MRRTSTRAGFALYEVLIGVTIFAVGILALGRSVENCLNASALTAEENRIRQLLSNRMAEIQATPGRPDETKTTKIDSGYGEVVLQERATAAEMKSDEGIDLVGVFRIDLAAKWVRHGIEQQREVMFYVYRQR